MRRQLLSKLQIYVEKWAGIIELLSNDGTPHPEISGNSMDIAISHMQVFEEWALKAYSIIKPDFTNYGGLTMTIPNKSETLQILKHHWPNMVKNIVAQGLGIDRSAFSRQSNKASIPDRNITDSVSN